MRQHTHCHLNTGTSVFTLSSIATLDDVLYLLISDGQYGGVTVFLTEDQLQDLADVIAAFLRTRLHEKEDAA